MKYILLFTPSLGMRSNLYHFLLGMEKRPHRFKRSNFLTVTWIGWITTISFLHPEPERRSKMILCRESYFTFALLYNEWEKCPYNHKEVILDFVKAVVFCMCLSMPTWIWHACTWNFFFTWDMCPILPDLILLHYWSVCVT